MLQLPTQAPRAPPSLPRRRAAPRPILPAPHPPARTRSGLAQWGRLYRQGRVHRQPYLPENATLETLIPTPASSCSPGERPQHPLPHFGEGDLPRGAAHAGWGQSPLTRGEPAARSPSPPRAPGLRLGHAPRAGSAPCPSTRLQAWEGRRARGPHRAGRTAGRDPGLGHPRILDLTPGL